MIKNYKWIIIFSSAAIWILFIFFIYWQIEYTKSEISKKKSRLFLILKMENQIIALNKTPIMYSKKNQPLLNYLEQEIKDQAFNAYVSGIKQEETNKIVINFSNIPFDRLIKWLKMLWEKNHIKVIKVDILPTNKNNIISCVVVFSQEGTK